MKTILNRTDLHEREKVLLYNQLLDRYNIIDEQRRQQPVRVSMVNPPGEAPTVLPPTTVDPSPAVSSLLESEIVQSAPKTLFVSNSFNNVMKTSLRSAMPQQ